MISRVAEEETVIDIASGDRGVAPGDHDIKPAKFSCLVLLQWSGVAASQDYLQLYIS